ncbi:MAG: chemotaxis protein CheD [bacterium]|nr:chemotaxis protein CheD [bacterium]
MSQIMVGIGGMATSSKPGDVIKTMALGSCVGVSIFTESPRTISLLHVALPDSNTSKEKSKILPGYFADTAIPKLVNELKKHGVSKNSKIYVKMAGGSNVLDTNNVFNIGKRNVLAIRKLLWKYKLRILKEDVGGNISRTVWIEYDTGKYYASCPAKGQWEI